MPSFTELQSVIHDDCGFWFFSPLSNGYPGCEGLFMRGFRFQLMTKFMDREKWFITHVIREICQNLHVKRDRDTSPPLVPSYECCNDDQVIKLPKKVPQVI